MIKRYSRNRMLQLWTDKAKYDAWLKVELAVCEIYHRQGLISNQEKLALDKADFSISRIKQLELETKHDVVAFTRSVSESLGPEKKWIHYGLTSTDVVDTANGLILKQVNMLLLKGILDLRSVLVTKAKQYKHTPCIGRTHGIHAEVSSFGLKFALWVDELDRQLKRFNLAREDIELGKISGAVGTCLYTTPKLQDDVCTLLNIKASAISTQVLQRDRHAFYISTLVLIASTLDKIATEMRHLQRTEVHEVEEAFSLNQKGSSAMPHKRNPISFENISGLSRLMRGYLIPAYEDINLWHERDISHSSVERVILPDATILLDYMLNRMTGLIKDLKVYEDRMLKNIELTHGLIFTQRVMSYLIQHKDLSREKAYDLVQTIAMKAYESQSEFKTLLSNDQGIIQYLNQSEIDECFDLAFYLKEVDAIYKRVAL